MRCEKSDEPVLVSKSAPMNPGNRWEDKTWMTRHLLHGLGGIQKMRPEAKGGATVKVVRRTELAYCNGMKVQRPES